MATTLRRKYHSWVHEPATFSLCSLCGWISSVIVCCIVCRVASCIIFAVSVSSVVMLRHFFGIAAGSTQKLRLFHPHTDMLHSRDQQKQGKALYSDLLCV